MASRPDVDHRSEGRKTVTVLCWLAGALWFLAVLFMNWLAWSGLEKTLLLALRDSGLFGAVPGLALYFVGRQILKHSFVAEEEEERFQRDADFMQYFHRKGRSTFEEIQQEFGMQYEEIRGYLIDLGGKRLFRGYVDWSKEEIVSIGEVDIGEECPGCSSRLNYLDARMAVCDNCGLQVFK